MLTKTQLKTNSHNLDITSSKKFIQNSRLLLVLFDSRPDVKYFKANMKYSVTDYQGQHLELRLSNNIYVSESRHNKIHYIVEASCQTVNQGKMALSFICAYRVKLTHNKLFKQISMNQGNLKFIKKQNADMKIELYANSVVYGGHQKKIVRLDDGYNLLILNALDGIDGTDLCLKNKNNNYISYDMIISFAYQFAQQLAKLHKCSILHNDIKPANMMFVDNKHAYLLDFGLAEFNNVFSRRGTPLYKPQWHDKTGNTQYTDIYAMGLSLIELLIGSHETIKTYKFNLYYLFEIIANKYKLSDNDPLMIYLLTTLNSLVNKTTVIDCINLLERHFQPLKSRHYISLTEHNPKPKSSIEVLNVVDDPASRLNYLFRYLEALTTAKQYHKMGSWFYFKFMPATLSQLSKILKSYKADSNKTTQSAIKTLQRCSGILKNSVENPNRRRHDDLHQVYIEKHNQLEKNLRDFTIVTPEKHSLR